MKTKSVCFMKQCFSSGLAEIGGESLYRRIFPANWQLIQNYTFQVYFGSGSNLRFQPMGQLLASFVGQDINIIRRNCTIRFVQWRYCADINVFLTDLDFPGYTVHSLVVLGRERSFPEATCFLSNRLSFLLRRKEKKLKKR